MKIYFYSIFTYFIIHGLIFTIIIGSIYSQSPRCVASVDRSSIEAGETINYTVEIIGADAQMAGYPSLPAMNGIELLSPSPGESTSIQIINGVKTESKSYHYVLRAVSKGSIRIEAAEVPYKKRIIRTNAVTLSVGGTSKGKEKSLAEDIYFRGEIARNELFIGEQLIVTFKIYTRFNANNYNITRLPNYIGFWAEELPVNQKNLEKVKIDGQIYRAEIIRRTAIFPAYPGELVIDAAEMDCEINIPRNRLDAFSDPFLSFFPDPFGQNIVRRLTTQPVSVKVKELPKQNQPKDFNGLVGQFEISMQFDKLKIKTGEPVTCRIVFSGAGNIMSAEIPNSPFPSEFEMFDPVTKYTIQREPTTIRGQKIIEWMAIPKHQGVYTIAPLSFSYYDPSLKKYISKQSAAASIQVTMGESVQSDSVSSPQKTSILADLKEFIDEPGTIKIILFNAWTFWILFIFPPATLTLFSGWQYVRPQILFFSEERKRKLISQSTVHNLMSLLETPADAPLGGLYVKLKKELLCFLRMKCGTEFTSTENQDFDSILRQCNISDELIKQVHNCIIRCDEACFSPQNDRSRLTADIQLCLNMIEQWDYQEREKIR